MRRLYLELLFKSLGQLRSAASVEEAVEVARMDPTIGRLVITNLYAFPYMSYYYGGMYVVMEAWQKRSCTPARTLIACCAPRLLMP
jgi:hypothetical protein